MKLRQSPPRNNKESQARKSKRNPVEFENLLSEQTLSW